VTIKTIVNHEKEIIKILGIIKVLFLKWKQNIYKKESIASKLNNSHTQLFTPLWVTKTLITKINENVHKNKITAIKLMKTKAKT
jgi:hypothetical protein